MRDHNSQHPVYLVTVHDALLTAEENKQRFRDAQQYLREQGVKSKALFSAAGDSDHDCEYLVIPEEHLEQVNAIAFTANQDHVIYLDFLRHAYSRAVPVQQGAIGDVLGELRAVPPGFVVGENERIWTDVNYNTRYRIAA